MSSGHVQFELCLDERQSPGPTPVFSSDGDATPVTVRPEIRDALGDTVTATVEVEG